MTFLVSASELEGLNSFCKGILDTFKRAQGGKGKHCTLPVL